MVLIIRFAGFLPISDFRTASLKNSKNGVGTHIFIEKVSSGNVFLNDIFFVVYYYYNRKKIGEKTNTKIFNEDGMLVGFHMKDKLSVSHCK